MTLVVGLRTDVGVVLASDSQRTEGSLRDPIPKLFTTRAGFAWGTAGSIAVQQEFYSLMERLKVPGGLPREATKQAVVAALRKAISTATEAMEEPSQVATTAAALIGWYSSADRHHYLLRVLGIGHGEFGRSYTAIGAPSEFARFAFSRLEHLEFRSLTLEGVQMVTFLVADDVIRASSRGVAPPVQVAVVTEDGAKLVQGRDLTGLEDTAAAFRDDQRGFMARLETPASRRRDTGIRP